MKSNPPRTQLAIELVSQAFVLDKFGSVGQNSRALADLLRLAAKMLDSQVKGPTEYKEQRP